MSHSRARDMLIALPNPTNNLLNSGRGRRRGHACSIFSKWKFLAADYQKPPRLCHIEPRASLECIE